MKKAGNWLAVALRPSLLFVGAGGFVVFLLWFCLGNLVPGFSEPELAARSSSATVKVILENPLYLPHKVLQLGVQRLGHDGPLALRSISALFGLAAVVSFYYVLKSWYTRRVAALGTLLFATSSWFLLSARLGTPLVTYTLLFAVVACAVWLQRSRVSVPAVLAGACLLLILLYIPGMIWFVVPGLIWQAPRLVRFLTTLHPALLAGLGLVGLGAFAPLGLAFYHDPGLMLTYLGLPQDFPGPLEVVREILRVPWQVFVRGPEDSLIGLGRLPLLDWFGAALFAVGLSAYFSNRRLDRVPMMLYVGGVGAVLVGLGGPVGISLLLPFVYIVIASGIALLLQQWFSVFPVNPVARTAGATLMTIAILLSCYYHISRAFIAWPNAPETRQTFHLTTESTTIERH